MRVVDVIENKKQKREHSKEEIDFLINSMMSGKAEDYQISAWLMAVCLNGLSITEIEYLTRAIINSGDVLDLSEISNDVVDKHSSGGVGDKVSIILIPLMAAAGLKVAKLSGRGLGLTGGTIDKLESIPNFSCALEERDFIEQVKKINCAIASQTRNLTPADAKLYALRDVTATIDNIGLITSSIISKKIAAGANHIVLDVKYGSGAFIKTKEEAENLSKLMVEIAKRLDKKVCAVISSMEEPLGCAVGNSLEIIESIEFLKGNMLPDLKEVTFKLASISLISAGKAKDEDEANKILTDLIKSGEALAKFKELIAAQNGDTRVIDDYSLFKQSQYMVGVKVPSGGIIKNVDAIKIAYASKILGAGRDTKSSPIDFSAGVRLLKRSGEAVESGDEIVQLYTDKQEKLEEAKKYILEAYEIANCKPVKKELIYKVIN